MAARRDVMRVVDLLHGARGRGSGIAHHHEIRFAETIVGFIAGHDSSSDRRTGVGLLASLGAETIHSGLFRSVSRIDELARARLFVQSVVDALVNDPLVCRLADGRYIQGALDDQLATAVPGASWSEYYDRLFRALTVDAIAAKVGDICSSSIPDALPVLPASRPDELPLAELSLEHLGDLVLRLAECICERFPHLRREIPSNGEDPGPIGALIEVLYSVLPDLVVDGAFVATVDEVHRIIEEVAETCSFELWQLCAWDNANQLARLTRILRDHFQVSLEGPPVTGVLVPA